MVKPKLRAGFWQKIGCYPLLHKTSDSCSEGTSQFPEWHFRKTLWVHAVSVGEVNAVEGFVKKLKE
ncbi:MAG: glycosyltransferase N-terminal domain-containing protein, partial [Candidatus Gastranaerophilaceae bacterium]